jgi:hypothetical protein
VFSVQHLFCSVRVTQFWARTPTRPMQVWKRPGPGIQQAINFEEPPASPQSANAPRVIFCIREVGCREMVMRSLLILVAICFSGTVFAQSPAPKVGNKPLVQLKPKAAMGCKLVGTVRGTKLWAGDCVMSELRGSTATTENQTLPEQATGSITPDQKE